MNLKKYSLLSFSLLTVLLYGCKMHPVKEVVNAPIHGSSHYRASDVKKIIIRAGTDLGWGMRPEGHGQIIGTIFVRSHMAKIRITYSRNSYSIHYLDSANLKYDGKNIHSGYNGWISNLEQRINSMLTSMH